jgi:RHS repeat-associated protein
VSNRFTGQILDEDTGLYYYSARYYDPLLARFIQPDTVLPDQSSQALNRYTYCNNNPLIFTDPSGNNPLLNFAINYAAGEAIETAFSVSAGLGQGMKDAQAVENFGGDSGIQSEAFVSGFKNGYKSASLALSSSSTGSVPADSSSTGGIFPSKPENEYQKYVKDNYYKYSN